MTTMAKKKTTTKTKPATTESKSKPGALAVVGPNAVMPYDYGDDVGGYENVTKDDQTIPFIRLQQQLSESVKSGLAEPGDFLDTVTEHVYDGQTGFLFVAGGTEHKYAMWMPRSMGGGFRGNLDVHDPVVTKAIQEANGSFKLHTQQNVDTPDGAQLVNMVLQETYYVYGVLCNDDGELTSMGCCIAFDKTKIKVYQKWMTRCRQYRRAPLYAHLTRITSQVAMRGDDEYHVPVMMPANPRFIAPDDSRFIAAQELGKNIRSGDIAPDYTSVDSDDSDTTGDSDIPF